MVVAALLFLALSLTIPLAFIFVRALQQGVDLRGLQALGEGGLLKLVGVDGVVTLLLVQNIAFALVPVVRVRWLRRESLADLGLRAERPLRLVAFGIGLGALVLLSNAALGAAFASSGVRQNQSAQYPLYAGDYLGQALFLLGAAVAAPVGEEVLFRGYVFSTLRRIWGGRPWGRAAAYGLSALLFALAHSLAATQGIVALLVPAFVMGLLLAWGRERSGSILPSVVAHGINNGLALVALLACINGALPCPQL
jgi:membrane protease YdiL (CAAX protease family)